MRGLWSREMVGWVMVAALLPLIAAALAEGASLRMAVVLAVTALWSALFRWKLGVPLAPTPVVMAVTVGLLAPNVALWALALGASFGIVVAELVFGGWGRNVVSAPLAALAFLSLSFPAAMPAEPGLLVAVAAWGGGAVLWLFGILRIGTVAAFGAVLAAMIAPEALVSAPVAILAVWCLADPVAAPTDRRARLAYGALAGGLAALIAATQGISVPGPMLFATLLAQIFAPLIDHLAIAARMRLRRKHA